MNTAQLKKEYKERIAPALMKQFNYSSPMQIPVLKKIVINQGLGSATQDKKIIDVAINELSAITGQKAVVAQVIVDVVRERRCAFEQVERTVACVDGCTFFGYGIENAIAVFRILAVHELELLHSGYSLVVEASDVVGGKLIPNQEINIASLLESCGSFGFTQCICKVKQF